MCVSTVALQRPLAAAARSLPFVAFLSVAFSDFVQQLGTALVILSIIDVPVRVQLVERLEPLCVLGRHWMFSSEIPATSMSLWASVRQAPTEGAHGEA